VPLPALSSLYSNERMALPATKESPSAGTNLEGAHSNCCLTVFQHVLSLDSQKGISLPSTSLSRRTDSLAVSMRDAAHRSPQRTMRGSDRSNAQQCMAFVAFSGGLECTGRTRAATRAAILVFCMLEQTEPRFCLFNCFSFLRRELPDPDHRSQAALLSRTARRRECHRRSISRRDLLIEGGVSPDPLTSSIQ
jgi:hypothetical protein